MVPREYTTPEALPPPHRAAAWIDGIMVNGTARTVGFLSGIVRVVQTGYLYHYAFAMIIGLLLLLSWFVLA